MRAPCLILLTLLLGSSGLFAADDVRRAQVAAATADALDTLHRNVLASSVTPTMSVRQFVDKTGSAEMLAKTLRQAEQIGGTRWLDDRTCQVRMELQGSAVADALVQVAEAKPREAGLPAEVLRQRVDRLRDVTFAATGMSTSATERLRPPPEQEAWRGVSEDAIHAAVSEARRNAASQVIESIEVIELPGTGTRLGKILADQQIHDALEGWLMNRPVTSVRFQDDLEVRVAVAVDGESLWNELAGAVADRKELGFPQDESSRAELRREVLRRVEPTVGRAKAKAAGAARPRAAVEIPHDPPRWAAEQVDARGSSRAVNGRLKTARAAESIARDRLRNRVEELPLSRRLTLGEAAQRDQRVRSAIDRTVERVRPRKVNYLADGSAEVSFSLDLRELWYEIERK